MQVTTPDSFRRRESTQKATQAFADFSSIYALAKDTYTPSFRPAVNSRVQPHPVLFSPQNAAPTSIRPYKEAVAGEAQPCPSSLNNARDRPTALNKRQWQKLPVEKSKLGTRTKKTG